MYAYFSLHACALPFAAPGRALIITSTAAQHVAHVSSIFSAINRTGLKAKAGMKESEELMLNKHASLIVPCPA